MCDGYKTTADLIPHMRSTPTTSARSNGMDSQQSPLYQPLTVVGVKPSQAFRSGDTMMIFPKYLCTATDADTSSTRTVHQVLDMLDATFEKNDNRGHDIPRMEKVSTLVLCVESLPEAGVDLSFTRPIKKYCKSIDELKVYYKNFEGLVRGLFLFLVSYILWFADAVIT
jgi:hypothetical protein